MSGLLLDTHIFLWHATNDPKLPRHIQERIQTESDPVFLSVISAWEIAVKVGIGKLELQMPVAELIGPSLVTHGIELLPLSVDEVIAYSELAIPNESHRDPFDRILVIQAKLRDLMLVTVDRSFEVYGLPLLS